MKLNNKLLLLIIIALVLNIMSYGNDKDQSEEKHIYSKVKRDREGNAKNSIKIIKNTMSRG